jgi:hypothetical protein
MDQIDAIEVSIGSLHKNMGLPENFQDVQSRMIQWRRDEGARSEIALIEIADDGDEIRLQFSRESRLDEVRLGQVLQFEASYLPGGDVLFLDNEGDAESLFEAFQDGFDASHLISQG